VLELPEVEVLRKDLEREVVGKRIKDVEVDDPKIVRPFHHNRPQFKDALEGRKIEAVRRRGTYVFLDLDNDTTWLVHPGDSASLHRETMNEPPGPDTDVVVTFTTGGAIHISDPTKGGSCTMGVLPADEVGEAIDIPDGAIDFFEDNPTWLLFADVLRDAEAPLKSVLMDETKILGIGEVYSDEALWESGLAHDRASDTLTTQEIRRLYRSIQEVLQGAIKQRGTSLDDATPDDAFDEEGEPVGHLRVYGREGQPCLRCRRTVVVTERDDGTRTYRCARCQV
jgi:formamidopyrimidine-DNA glycosylase